ncbi:MAG: mercury methylation corrinoid protein HgcA [Rectinemataceae bacterium]
MELKPARKKVDSPLVGYAKFPDDPPPYVTGYMEIAGRFVPLVSTRLSIRDKIGDWGVRWDLGRGAYRVVPGLYALGHPGLASPVLVTANYKLTFDELRKQLAGLDAFIAVLDTKGVNVWCAAGKGSFGTTELLDKIARLRLGDLVSHKVLVLPQLGASGVSAPEIARVSRFRVVWGPVRASDLPAFLAAGMVKTEAMRSVEFGLADRMAVAPVEFVHSWPFLLGALLLSLAGALPLDMLFRTRFWWLFAATAGSVVMGTFAFPALLPLLPSRAFSIKGAVLGALWGALCAALAVSGGAFGPGARFGLGAALVLVSAAVTSFTGLNFTGSSTFTSQRGATFEVEKSLIPTIAALAFGICLGGASLIFGL